MIVSLIVAKSSNHIIGKDGGMPWRLPNDLKYFKATTMGHCVIMGRKTHQSIGKPLPGRTNIVLSSRLQFEGCEAAQSLAEGLGIALLKKEPEVFIAGGANVYGQALAIADRLYITEIDAQVEGDTYLPFFDVALFQEVKRVRNEADDQHAYNFDFVVYERK